MHAFDARMDAFRTLQVLPAKKAGLTKAVKHVHKLKGVEWANNRWTKMIGGDKAKAHLSGPKVLS